LKLNENHIAIFLLFTQCVGIIFVGIFLAAYLAGLPTTAVLHSEPTVRLSLALSGSVLLILSLLTVIMAMFFGGKVKSEKLILHTKIGSLIVAASYFLFTLHATFTLSWIGEWEQFGGSLRFIILVEDISATVGLIFRFAASILAFVMLLFLLFKESLLASSFHRILRTIFVFEGLYWLGLIATAGFSILNFGRILSRSWQILPVIYSLLTSVIPTVLEAVVLPSAFFILAYKLNQNKPINQAIRWGLITATTMIAVFWLVNTSIWINLLDEKGWGYLTTYPEHFLSFTLTTIGLAALTFYMAYFTKKSSGAKNVHELKIRSIRGIILALGTYFLSNYLIWILFAGDTWNNWYAWFLGHNMDLWMLSLPLLGLPLLFHNDRVN